MNSKLVPALLLLAASPLALAAQPSGNTGNVTRTFSKTIPAAGLTGMKLTARVGTIHITTANTDTVSVKAVAEAGNHMHFIFDWTTGSSSTTKLPADLHLVTRREGTQLVVSLATSASPATTSASPAGSTASPATTSASPAGSTASENDTTSYNITINIGSNSGWKTDWTLVLPARLALDLTLGVGKAKVTGIKGGLRVRIGVGKLHAQLPQGPVNADVGVGNIKTFIATADYGKVKLAAGVGGVKFSVGGHPNDTGYEKQFTAADQHVTGGGKTAYTLKAGVGHVDLALGVKNPPQSNAPD